MKSNKSKVMEVKREKSKNIFKISLSLILVAFVFDMSTGSSFQIVKPAIAAPLTGVSVVPTSGLKNQRTTYDIFLTTATTGTIKTIEITFPSSFDLSQATKLIERSGIGSGSLSSSGSTLKYTVINPVSVSSGTTIRLEIASIIAINAGSFTVNIRTIHTQGATIDGITTSGSFLIRSVFGQDVSTSFMIRKTLHDDPAGNSHGWDPDGATDIFAITDSDLSGSQDTAFVSAVSTDETCQVRAINPQFNEFTVICDIPPMQLTDLQYLITKLPANVVTSTLSASSSESNSLSESSSQYESLRAHDQIASEFP